MSEIAITLEEWKTVGPEEVPLLGNWTPADKPELHALIHDLAKKKMLEINPLFSGCSIKTYSFVGTIRVGSLRITILPKIRGINLLRLFRYAYKLRDLRFLTEVRHGADDPGLLDLLIQQLRLESEELIRRGLHRSYLRRHERLAYPRGRIDFSQLVAQQGVVAGNLPCIHHQREEDILLNKVLLAGLDYASRITEDLELRSKVRGTAAKMRDNISLVTLDTEVWNELARARSRLVHHYDAALTLIHLLTTGQGPTFEEEEEMLPTLPGFLFDMNRFFQRLLSRFLRENLPEYDVQDEFGLSGMMAYLPEYNPQARRPPVPRPDFVIRNLGITMSVLDAKYRDIWERGLPREMLYQLAMYALGRRGGNEVSILYPTTNQEAKESRLEILDPEFQRERRAIVCLRPVDLLSLGELLSSPDSQSILRKRRKLAEGFAGISSS